MAMITIAVSQKSTAVPTVQLLSVYSCLIACDNCGQRVTKITPYTANRATESSGELGARAGPVEPLQHHDLHGADGEILVGRGVLHDVRLLAAVALFHHDEVGPQLRPAHRGREGREGGGGALRTTCSPGASPLTISRRPSATVAPTATARSMVPPFSQTSTYPCSAITSGGIASTRRRSAPTCTVTLAPGRSREESASWRTNSRVPLAASISGEARITRAATVVPSRPSTRADEPTSRPPPLLSGTWTETRSGH